MNWNLIIRTYRLIYSCDGKGFLWLLFLSATGALLPLANLTVLKRLVDIGLEGNDFRQLMLYVVIFSAIFFLSYPGSDTPVLNHFSLTARKGEITRIEGPNGFGKTTMVKLLLRLYDPQEGRVLVNGTDIRKFALEDLRHRVSATFRELSANRVVIFISHIQ